jgi:hypothetical protein
MVRKPQKLVDARLRKKELKERALRDAEQAGPRIYMGPFGTPVPPMKKPTRKGR